jgi:hypothetical protein
VSSPIRHQPAQRRRYRQDRIAQAEATLTRLRDDLARLDAAIAAQVVRSEVTRGRSIARCEGLSPRWSWSILCEARRPMRGRVSRSPWRGWIGRRALIQRVRAALRRQEANGTL